MLLVVTAGAEPPIRRKGPDAGQVAVELGGEEAGSAHLAVADHVDAGRFLVADREVDGVVEHLGEVGRPELAALGRRDPRGEPARMGVRPDDAGQEKARAVAGRIGRVTRASRGNRRRVLS